MSLFDRFDKRSFPEMIYFIQIVTVTGRFVFFLFYWAATDGKLRRLESAESSLSNYQIPPGEIDTVSDFYKLFQFTLDGRLKYLVPLLTLSVISLVAFIAFNIIILTPTCNYVGISDVRKKIVGCFNPDEDDQIRLWRPNNSFSEVKARLGRFLLMTPVFLFSVSVSVLAAMLSLYAAPINKDHVLNSLSAFSLCSDNALPYECGSILANDYPTPFNMTICQPFAAAYCENEVGFNMVTAIISAIIEGVTATTVGLSLVYFAYAACKSWVSSQRQDVGGYQAAVL